jgi:CheY-like chemotaxis protein
LIVEDERIIALEIKKFLLRLGYSVVGSCSTEDEAYTLAASQEIDLVLMDIYLIESNGIDAAIKIKEKQDIPIIFLTAYMDDETIENFIIPDRQVVIRSRPGMGRDVTRQGCEGKNKNEGQGDFSAFRIQKRPFHVIFSLSYF